MQKATDLFPICVTPRHPRKATILQALSAVDQVHGFPAEIPPLGVRTERFNANLFGMFDPYNEKYGISIADNGDFPALTVVHEIGHVLDSIIFPRGEQLYQQYLSIRSRTAVPWDAWWQSISASQLFQTLQTQQNTLKQDLKRKRLFEHVNYLLDSKELFARAYAQFIAQESKNAILLQEIHDSPKGKGFPVQWESGDFKRVHQEILQILIFFGLK
jgi:hypothetical protein